MTQPRSSLHPAGLVYERVQLLGSDGFLTRRTPANEASALKRGYGPGRRTAARETPETIQGGERRAPFLFWSLSGLDAMQAEDRERLGLGLMAYRIIARGLPW